MGNTTTTQTYIGVEGNSLYKEIKVNGKVETRIWIGIKEKDKVVFSEKEWEEIRQIGYKDIDFCILDNGTNGISECMGLFADSDRGYASELDQFAVTKGPISCRSFFYRPGLVYNEGVSSEDIEKEIGRPETGKLCRIVFQDYNYNDEDQERCCFSDNKSKCNKKLINGYTTTHCNVVMKKKCNGDELNPKCMLWLENNYTRLENSALEFYSDFCSKNHSSLACNYFCKIARENNDYRSAYCDKALTTFCNNNQFDSRCHCVVTPTNIIPSIESFLGPKECWLSPCSSQPDSKWLTTNQLDTREKCNLTSCIISIDTLILKNQAKAELINDCVSGTSVNSSYNLEKRDKNKLELTPGILLYPNVGLLALSLILLLRF